ncbi:hypothetical protein CFP56_012568 [Quercus suber]|uniref:Uncharacterized protein n=1 Tax=Quercus suber TaxID=58331 RepID=A0AAW0KVF4_QUESU
MEMFELMRRRSESNIVDCYAYYEDWWYDLRYSSSWNWSRLFCDCPTGYKGNPYLSSCQGSLGHPLCFPLILDPRHLLAHQAAEPARQST